MKLTTPVNENYAAVVVSVKVLNDLEGLDNLVGIPLLGYQALALKETTKVGQLGILFVAETQLDPVFMHENNLFRHGNFNKDQSKKGYIEDNRRIRAIRLRGHLSSALFMPLESLEYTGIKIKDLKEGDTFDTLNGKEICRKFIKKQKKSGERNVEIIEKYIRVDKKFMPEHIDSLNYWKNEKLIKGNRFITVTQKLHGTSIRIGNTLVNRKLKLREKFLKRLGVKIVEKEYDNVYGSRKVIKDINNPHQNHFYSTDLWTETGKKLDGLLPEGYVLYGEIIGYAGDGVIQKNYTYNLPVGNNELYVYRVSIINNQGIQNDLSWDQVKQFCKNAGLKHVPELWSGRKSNFKIDNFIDKKFFEEGYKTAISLCADSPVDEGVVVRAEGIIPTILKAKSPRFLEHETKMLDEEAVDLEAQESETIENENNNE